jgi:TRAP-type transport system periplasmic protein
MEKRIFILIIAVMILCTLTVLCSNATELPTLNWVLQTVETSLTDPRVEECVKFADRVAQRTDGKFNIRVTLAKELGIDRDEFPQALANGSIEMAWLNTSVMGGILPYTGIFNLPYLTTDQDSCLTAAEAISDMVFEDMKKLGYQPIPPNSFFVFATQDLLSKDPIPNLADLSGLNIRVWRDLDAKLIQTLGGTPIYMPVTDVYVAMQRGVVDAVNTGPNGMVMASLWEVGKHYYAVELEPSGAWVGVNNEKWEKLPTEYKKIVEEENTAMIKAMYDKHETSTIEQQNILVKNGVIIHQLSEEEIKVWRDAGKPIWEEWAQQDPRNQKALDATMKALDL